MIYIYTQEEFDQAKSDGMKFALYADQNGYGDGTVMSLVNDDWEPDESYNWDLHGTCECEDEDDDEFYTIVAFGDDEEIDEEIDEDDEEEI